nr:palindromic element RPE4 domain-containing protein [Rickettsia bellii]
MSTGSSKLTNSDAVVSFLDPVDKPRDDTG